MDAVTPKALLPEDDEDLFKAAPVNAFREFWDAGYRELIPIIPPGATLSPDTTVKPEMRGKTPGKRRDDGTWIGFGAWTSHGATKSELDEWSLSGAGVGLQTRNYAAIDIDVTDAPLAEQIKSIVKLELGEAPCRTGNAPKALLLYSVDGPPLRKMRLTFQREGDLTAKTHAVEVLGNGQQFVAYGTHPKTGRPYHWDDLPVRSELTAVDGAKVVTCLDTISAHLRSRGYIVDAHTATAALDGRKAPPDFVLDDPSTIAWARRHLAREPIAIHGQGGRQRTINVAMTLVDRGLSDEKVHELMCEPGGWNDCCVPPWDTTELRDLILSLEGTRENERGCDYVAPAAETFTAPPASVSGPGTQHDDVLIDSDRAPRVPVIEIGDLWDVGRRRPVEYLVKDFLIKRGTATIVGRRGAGKSLLIVDILMSVASGQPVLGRWEVLAPGTVIYLHAEGQNDLWSRVHAWLSERNKTRAQDARIMVEHAATNLWQYPDVPHVASKEVVDAYVDAIHRRIKRTGQKPLIIVIDTQARATRGQEENSAKDMAVFAAFKDHLQKEFGCMVIAVAHAGKQDSTSVRGSSVIEDSDDIVFAVTGKNGAGTIETTKANYSTAVPKTHFRLIKQSDLPPNLEGVATPDGFALRLDATRRDDVPALDGVCKELYDLMRARGIGTNSMIPIDELPDHLFGQSEPLRRNYKTEEQHHAAVVEWQKKRDLWKERLRKGVRERTVRGKVYPARLEDFFEERKATYGKHGGKVVPHFRLPERFHVVTGENGAELVETDDPGSVED